jgi:hypothetical protein
LNPSTIQCPECQHEFLLTAAIEQPIVEKLRAKLVAEVSGREADCKKREQQMAAANDELKRAQESVQQLVEAKLAEEKKRIVIEQAKRAREDVAVEVRELKEQLSEKSTKLADAQKAELELRKARVELEESKANFELEKMRLIEAERGKIREEAKKAISESFANQLALLKDELTTKNQRLAAAQEAELELRKQQQDFEQQKKELDLHLARQADEVRERTRKEKDEEFRLKEAESNKKLADMNRQIDELKRKAEIGSQQAQGEVLELDLEASLRRCFPFDEITPVAKGSHGGDVLQHVRDETGQSCGIIIWESKRTKAWSDGWIPKLKDDKLAAKAQLAVLVTAAMPKDVPTFECRENVWVTPPMFSVALTAALRMMLIETAAAKRAIDGRQDKMSVMYDYVAGPQFKGRVTAIVEAFMNMRDDLEQEKRAVTKSWAKREKQIERVLMNTTGLHGDLAGILGKSLPSIETLELDALPDELVVEQGEMVN